MSKARSEPSIALVETEQRNAKGPRGIFGDVLPTIPVVRHMGEVEYRPLERPNGAEIEAPRETFMLDNKIGVFWGTHMDVDEQPTDSKGCRLHIVSFGQTCG